jgi:hypothetical protein
MQIQFDDTQIQAALDKAASDALANAFGSYASKSAMEEVISKAVIPEIISKALNDAASRVNVEALTVALASQIARTITGAAVCLMRSAAVEMILDLRKVPQYDDDKRNRARAEVIVELGAAKQEEEEVDGQA